MRLSFNAAHSARQGKTPGRWVAVVCLMLLGMLSAPCPRAMACAVMAPGARAVQRGSAVDVCSPCCDSGVHAEKARTCCDQVQPQTLRASGDPNGALAELMVTRVGVPVAVGGARAIRLAMAAGDGLRPPRLTVLRI